MPASQKDLEVLKKPFGTLVADKDVTKSRISAMLAGSKKVVAVGDATTERLVSFGIIPDIAVIDGKERRSKRHYPDNYNAKQVRCANPAGTISKEAVGVLQDALKSNEPVRVLIEGEEDMLALPLFVMAPEGSAVLYGQPLEGLVVVKITAAKRKQAKDLMEKITDNADLISSRNAITDTEQSNDIRKSHSSISPKSSNHSKKDRRI